jgi:hypothetical protein
MESFFVNFLKLDKPTAALDMVKKGCAPCTQISTCRPLLLAEGDSEEGGKWLGWRRSLMGTLPFARKDSSDVFTASPPAIKDQTRQLRI